MTDPTAEAAPRRDLPVYGLVALHAGTAALPVLFAPIFSVDWVNHLWFAHYVARALAADWTAPMFVNVSDQIGNPLLALYGSGLYVGMFPFVQLAGPEIGTRAAIAVAMLLPNVAMAALVRRLTGHDGVTVCVTVILSTSVYQMTNAYTRAALTEFFAYQLLLFGLLACLSVLAADGDRRGALGAVVGFTSAGLGLLAHPPTAYLAAVFLTLPALALIVARWPAVIAVGRSQPFVVAMAALVAAVPVVLWGALAVANLRFIAVSQAPFDRLYFFPASIDHWWARLLPWPVDVRVEIEGFNLVSTPYLSAPVNTIGLLLLCALIVVAWRRRMPWGLREHGPVTVVVAGSLLSAVAGLLLSVPLGTLQPTLGPDGTAASDWFYAAPASWRGRLLGNIQFAYRVVNVVNLAIIVGTLGLLLEHARGRVTDRPSALRAWPGPRHVILAGAAGICIVTTAMKTVEVYREFVLLPQLSVPAAVDRGHAAPSGGLVEWVSRPNVERRRREVRDTTSAPGTQYGLRAYAMPALFPALAPGEARRETAVRLTPRGPRSFAGRVRCEQDCMLTTKLVPSRWFVARIDGRPVPVTSVRVHRGFVAIPADAGDHDVTVQLGTWVTQSLGYGLLALAAMFWCSVTWMGMRAWRRRVRPWRPMRGGHGAS